MALSNEDILNAISEMSVMDVVALVSAMEEKFGVSAQGAHSFEICCQHLLLCDGFTSLSLSFFVLCRHESIASSVS